MIFFTLIISYYFSANEYYNFTTDVFYPLPNHIVTGSSQHSQKRGDTACA